MSSEPPNEQALRIENADLRARLLELQETLGAIRAGEVDALVVQGSAGPQVFTLQSSDAEASRVRGDILANVSDAVIAVDNDERLIYLNTAAEQQYGVKASEALGRRLREIYDYRWLRPEDEAEAMAALAERGRWSGENVHVKRNGEVIHVESSVSRLLGTNGQPSGLFATIRDVTQRRAAGEALRLSEERFRVLFDLGPVAIFSCDRDGNLQNYNRRAAELWSHSRVAPLDAIHCRSFQFFRRDAGELPYEESPLAEVLRTGVGEEDEDLIMKRADGTQIAVSATFAPLRDAQGEIIGAIAALHDITERRILEDALVARAAELAQADRRKDEFLAMLAHELRNPLAPIRNGVEILKDPAASPEDQQHAQEILGRQIENMTRMIDDLLDVSRITKGKIALRPEAVSLASILTSAANGLRSTFAKRGQVLHLSLPPESLHLMADATRLEQVFGNLLGNASKYSGDGRAVYLSTEDAGTDGAPEILVRIRDEGIGISAELIPRVFDLFVQATRSLDRAYGGLGIGLTLVRRLVELHGGIVEAHSEGSGRGSEFTVRLPVLQTAPARASAPAEKKPERLRRMLIVDDNTDAARSLAMIQRRRGHETRTAFSGPDAVAIAAEFLPEVVLLDIGLPGMDGLEVARRLRNMKSLNGVSLIAMTGYGRDEDRAEARLAGFDYYLVKPVDLDQLQQWLHACDRER